MIPAILLLKTLVLGAFLGAALAAWLDGTP